MIFAAAALFALAQDIPVRPGEDLLAVIARASKGAVVALAGFLTDFDGAKRPALWDVGADEFQAGPARPLRPVFKG